MTEADVAECVAAKLLHGFFVGQRVKLFSGKTGTVAEIGPTGVEIVLDPEWKRGQVFHSYIAFDFVRPL